VCEIPPHQFHMVCVCVRKRERERERVRVYVCKYKTLLEYVRDSAAPISHGACVCVFVRVRVRV